MPHRPRRKPRAAAAPPACGPPAALGCERASEAAAPSSPPSTPTLTKPGYWVRPSLAALAALPPAALASVAGFAVGCGHGSVAWDVPVDVRGLNLDTAVVFGPGEVDVYPRAFYPAPPPEGAGLNAPATVRLAAGDVLAAAAGRQPRRAAAGSVRLSLRARGRAGGDGGGAAAAAQWDEWEVPLGGGACALVRGGGALDGAQPEATAAAAAAGCGGGRGGALENAGAGGPAWALRTARAPMDDVDP